MASAPHRSDIWSVSFDKARDTASGREGISRDLGETTQKDVGRLFVSKAEITP